jgi:AbrB family looped-hinge helix DNA binding protein
MAGRFVRVRERNQITVPPEVAERLAVRPGDIVEFSFSPAGTVELRPAKIVAVGTPEALQEEEAAKEDIRQGRYSVITNVDEFVDRVRKGDYPSARQMVSPGLFHGKIVPPEELVLAGPPESEMEGYVGPIEDTVGNLTALQELLDLGVEPSNRETDAVSSLTPLQKVEVQRIVEETVKKYVSGGSRQRSIIPQRAENTAE